MVHAVILKLGDELLPETGLLVRRDLEGRGIDKVGKLSWRVMHGVEQPGTKDLPGF